MNHQWYGWKENRILGVEGREWIKCIKLAKLYEKSSWKKKDHVRLREGCILFSYILNREALGKFYNT